MKKKDVKAGDVLYAAKGNQWMDYGDGDKVTVIHPEPKTWYFNNKTNEYQERYTRSHHAKTGVLVMSTDYGRQRVCPLTQLRGQYDTVKAEVDAYRQQKSDAETRKRLVSEAARAHRDAVMAEAYEAGYRSIRTHYGVRDDVVVIGVDELEKMLKAATGRM